MDILTGDNDFPPFAQKRIRIAAALIDMIILFAGCYLIAYLSGQTYQTNASIGFELEGAPALAAMLYGFLLMPVNEGLTGQTLGKRLLNIKVVKADYSNTTLATSIIRHLFDLIDYFFLIGIIVAASNNNKQRIGDLVAKTYVVTKH